MAKDLSNRLKGDFFKRLFGEAADRSDEDADLLYEAYC